MISNIDRRPAPAGQPQEDEMFRQMFRKPTLHHFGTLLQIDNRLDLGSSGGAVVNMQGQLVGIATSLAALEGYEKSVGYAVPLDASTHRIIDSLARGQEVEYGFLGIEPQDFNRETSRQRGFDATFDQISAARVQIVYEQSPAQRGGLLANDVVLKVSGHPIFSADDLIRDIGQLGPGATAKIHVWRASKRKELDLAVELGKWPVFDDEGIIATVPRFGQWRGLSVDYSTARYKYLQQGTFQQFQSVLVTQIAPRTSAARSNLKEGDLITHVNDTPIASPADFQRAVRGLAGDVKLELVGRAPVTVSQ
jgi:serine protease Do